MQAWNPSADMRQMDTFQRYYYNIMSDNNYYRQCGIEQSVPETYRPQTIPKWTPLHKQIFLRVPTRLLIHVQIFRSICPVLIQKPPSGLLLILATMLIHEWVKCPVRFQIPSCGLTVNAPSVLVSIRLHQVNVNWSRNLKPISQTLWSTSAVLASDSRYSQAALLLSTVLSDSTRAFSDPSECMCIYWGAFTMLWDLTSSIVQC